MKEYEMNLNTEFLNKIAEYDRTDPKQKLNAWTYDTDEVINGMVKDIQNGVGIKNPVEVVVCDGKALMIQGCHRLAAAKKAGLKKLPAIVVFFQKLTGKFKENEHKFRQI